MRIEIIVINEGTFIEIDGAPAVSSACSGAETGTSGTEAISADPQRSGDSLRKIREIADEALASTMKTHTGKLATALREIRELCSNENRSGKET